MPPLPPPPIKISLIHIFSIRMSSIRGLYVFICLDAGEDLWLCMLLLRQGYHIQYCETAEAETVAPTTLPELFKQRRRWVSSGFLNTLFFIRSAKRTLKFNDHATALYLLYHVCDQCYTSSTVEGYYTNISCGQGDGVIRGILFIVHVYMFCCANTEDWTVFFNKHIKENIHYNIFV